MQDNEIAPIEDCNIIRSGNLTVSGGHQIYWVDWGNPEISEPIFHLHGGPGAGFSERDFSKFDPALHRVIFHDQRGAGRSTPYASIAGNTTDDLLSDINTLKQELGFKKISLYGRSWGSTLALLYAIKQPELINTMLIGGIFLARKSDTDLYFRGAIASFFPEVWEDFSNPAGSPEETAEFYRDKLLKGTEQEQKRYSEAWMRYEASIMKLDYVPKNIDRVVFGPSTRYLAILEAHYLLNNSFIPENYILDNVSKLAKIKKIIIVQGRYDMVCVPQAAYQLHANLKENSLLHIVAAGHASGDPLIREVEQAYIHMLF
jgi:proline iminopeptidase